jgi:hypothetical protein
LLFFCGGFVVKVKFYILYNILIYFIIFSKFSIFSYIIFTVLFFILFSLYYFLILFSLCWSWERFVVKVKLFVQQNLNVFSHI